MIQRRKEMHLKRDITIKKNQQNSIKEENIWKIKHQKLCI